MYYHQIGSYETKCDDLREVTNRNKVRLQNGVMANRGLFGSKTTEPKAVEFIFNSKQLRIRRWALSNSPADQPC